MKIVGIDLNEMMEMLEKIPPPRTLNQCEFEQMIAEARNKAGMEMPNATVR